MPLASLSQSTSNSTGLPSAFEQCPACLAKWSATQTVRVPLPDELSDEMLDGGANLQLQELVYERCASCRSLLAVDRRRDPRRLEEIYRMLPPSYWQRLNPHVGFHRVIENHLARRGVVGGQLWDIGCGRGNLLETFAPRWSKTGVEPGLEAVAEGRRRGVNIMAGTASSLGLQEVADVAMLVDVVEHLSDPAVELRAVRDMIRPGGTLVLFTGTADAWTARVAGPRWYYLHCIGHVTVFSWRALQSIIEQLGFDEVTTYRVEHPSAVSARRWLARLGTNELRRVLGRPLAPVHHFRDHQLVLATKRAVGAQATPPAAGT